MIRLFAILLSLLPLSLERTPDGKLQLTYERDGRIESVITGDDGVTWSAPAVIPGPAGNLQGKPVVLRSGMYLRPVQKDSCVAVEASMDRGKNWMQFGGNIRLTEKVYDGMNRPELIPMKDGRLALLTSAHGYQWRYRSVSSNFGQSWSKPEPWICCPFTGSSVTVLPSGKWLLVKNGKIDQNLFYVPDRLYAYLSDDEGETWYGGMKLDDRTDVVNPVVCAPGNGSVYIAYAYAPEDGHAAEIKFVKTGEVEICNSLLTASRQAVDVKMAVDCNKEAKARYDEWYKKITSSKGSWAKETLRVVSYNIEYVSNKAGVPAWKDRLEYVNWLFREYDFDVVGVQEPWEPEYQQLKEALGDRWESIRACTSIDSESPSFSNIIFWKRERVEKLDDGVFWYTENPGQKGGFGGASSRLCIWAKFRDKKTGKIFYHFNSHFDFVSMEAALVSSRLLLKKVREIAGFYPAFCTGDYNCTDESPAMRWIVDSGFLADSKTKAEKSSYAELSTVRHYKKDVPKGTNQIDHLYFTVGKSKVKYWQLLLDEHNGLYGGSDHIPICVDWLISN